MNFSNEFTTGTLKLPAAVERGDERAYYTAYTLAHVRHDAAPASSFSHPFVKNRLNFKQACLMKI